MYTSIGSIKLTEIDVERGKYKRGKFVHHKNPIERDKKVVFEDDYTNLIDLVSEIKHASERSPDKVIRVSFDVTAEW